MAAEMSMLGRLETVDAIRRYIFAGNATFTLRSRATGTRYTYKVSKADEKPGYAPMWFVSVLTGPENETDFQYMGIFKAGPQMVHDTIEATFKFTDGSKVRAGAPSADVFVWFARNVLALNRPPGAALEVWHEGRCGRCGRKLTVPESIAAGLGPECEGRV